MPFIAIPGMDSVSASTDTPARAPSAAAITVRATRISAKMRVDTASMLVHSAKSR